MSDILDFKKAFKKRHGTELVDKKDVELGRELPEDKYSVEEIECPNCGSFRLLLPSKKDPSVKERVCILCTYGGFHR